ncbi:glycosyltransferase [Bordetella bronchiseptica]|uniref:glycosyltransferase n=1 Tax=Bordetella bronchiseptica TaxID=518 RepID=UPI00028AB4BF|nr:glycosyltransferase [Bordetella bronchiseptica]KDD58732.1 glycosyltransferase, group 1 family protein [Bordetella bronchiseptica OSU553]AWQ03306.1 glycosyltransferase [Bordetella bronchiseptica]KAK51515.1 glycosyltransferase, group 1 family protein [Bordetella bronchiseptica OSU054]KDB78810.1 glycosyltransferase, group 1 family protein [Bordetella bronchiseptica CA90 BB1334]KDD43513.1 glycosyltransferase, group 1 family protein [Bordetella bronchiseptica OSU095]
MKRPERLLLVCYFDPQGIETVIDNIGYVKTYSNFHVDILNLYGASSSLTRGEDYRLNAYDGVIIHNTISYNPANLESIDRQFVPSIRDYEGAKIILKQDEQYRTLAVAEFIGSRQFDVVFTCVDAAEREKAYPSSVVGTDVAFHQMYTGYVTPKLRARTTTAIERDIDISYRGSLQPLYFGRLAYDKQRIGHDVAQAAQARNMRIDISSRWEDRLMGEDWFRFLARSKSTLGVESGASIFDFDGSAERLCAELERRRPEFPDEHAYSEWVLKQLEPYEGNVYYNQISPRHFEAGAARALQVMYEGRYSNIFLPWKHFVPLCKDLSNFDEVCEYINDPRLRSEVVDRTYDEIIVNPIYSMRHFVATLDDAIASALEHKPHRAGPTQSAPRRDGKEALLLCAHPPAADPRIGWVADYAPPDVRVHILGVSDQPGAPSIRQRPNGALEICIPRHEGTQWADLALGKGEQGAALHALCRLQLLAQLSPAQLNQLVGGGVSSERAHHFNWTCRHLVRTAETLLQGGLGAAGYTSIIAADFDTLIPALILKRLYGTPVLYDAHEFWPTSLGPDTAAWEIEIWQTLERSLLSEVDRSISVSPQLAAHMSELYGHPFATVPNCEPLAALQPEPSPPTASDARCVFLFQGVFMPGRGLELLIRAWQLSDERAILELRGPDRPYKRELQQLAERTGLLGKRIFFPDAVRESELVAAATHADVGLVPYEPTTLNSRYCSPNKLSQYMAAGLPILANKLDFVGLHLERAACGEQVDFALEDQLVAAINRYAGEPGLRHEQGARARQYFERTFHWEACSAPLYAALTAISGNETQGTFRYNPASYNSTATGESRPNIIKRLMGRTWHALPASMKNAMRPWLLKTMARLRK